LLQRSVMRALRPATLRARTVSRSGSPLAGPAGLKNMRAWARRISRSSLTRPMLEGT